MLISENRPHLGKTFKNPTIELLRAIGSPFSPRQESEGATGESEELYRHAVKNKISLLYLEVLEQQGRLNELKREYEEEHNRYLNLFKAIGKVSHIFYMANIEYAVFKTIKPYPAIPTDIDVIISGDDGKYKKAVETLLKARYLPSLPNILDVNTLTGQDEYEKAVKILTEPTYEKAHISPTGVGFRDTEHDFTIDLQKQVATSYVVYIDKNKFKGHIIKAEVPGERGVRTLTPELDLATMVAHSLMEQIYHLGEFYTFLYHLSKMDESKINNFIDVVKENNLKVATKAFTALTTQLHKEAYGTIPEKIEFILDKLGGEASEAKNLVRNNFRMPHKYRALTVARFFLEKLKEPTFRRSILVQIIRMLNPKLARLVITEVIDMRRRKDVETPL